MCKMLLFGKLHGKDAPIRPAQVRQKEFALQGGGAAAQQLHRLGGLDGRAEGGREREGALFIGGGGRAVDAVEHAASGGG